jgi:hypothetical protein
MPDPPNSGGSANLPDHTNSPGWKGYQRPVASWEDRVETEELDTSSTIHDISRVKGYSLENLVVVLLGFITSGKEAICFIDLANYLASSKKLAEEYDIRLPSLSERIALKMLFDFIKTHLETKFIVVSPCNYLRREFESYGLYFIQVPSKRDVGFCQSLSISMDGSNSMDDYMILNLLKTIYENHRGFYRNVSVLSGDRFRNTDEMLLFDSNLINYFGGISQTRISPLAIFKDIWGVELVSQQNKRHLKRFLKNKSDKPTKARK